MVLSLVGAFLESADYSSGFFKTEEVTDFINFYQLCSTFLEHT